MEHCLNLNQPDFSAVHIAKSEHDQHWTAGRERDGNEYSDTMTDSPYPFAGDRAREWIPTYGNPASMRTEKLKDARLTVKQSIATLRESAKEQ
jgi:hypothetical protein